MLELLFFLFLVAAIAGVTSVVWNRLYQELRNNYNSMLSENRRIQSDNALLLLKYGNIINVDAKVAEIVSNAHRQADNIVKSAKREQQNLMTNISQIQTDIDNAYRTFNYRRNLPETHENLKVKHEELKERVRQLTDELKEAKRDGKNVALSSKERDKFLLQFDKLGKTYIEDTFKFVVSKMTISNYTASRDRILKSIGVCRTIGFDWADNLETEYAERIKDEYKRVLRIEEMRLEQQRVKEQIKEEQRALRELEAIKKKEEQAIKEREAAEKTRAEMQRAIAEALEKASGEHTAQILEMERILAEKNKEIELKKQEIDDSQRAIANAQITKVGNVYVLSNIGSFGQNVYKIGMTRRDNPDDRVKELGDASVPFPFDVHIMVGADNAPELEKMLHHRFNRQRVNKVNLRKEFFRVGIEDIQKEIETFLNKKVEYRADPRIMEEYAEEYRQSEHISETDIEEIEKMFDESGIETDE